MSDQSGDEEELNLAQRVQLRLAALNLSQTQVSKSLNKRDFVGQLLRGEKARVTDANLRALAKVLHTTEQYLTTGEKEMPPPAKAPGNESFRFRIGVSPKARQTLARSTVAPDRDEQFVKDNRDQFSQGSSLPPSVWSARLKPIAKISDLARSKATTSDVDSSRPIRTALPVFDLYTGSVGDLLDLRRLTWASRPSDLIGTADAYAIRLCRDLAVGWPDGAMIVLTPRREVTPGDPVLAIHSPGQTGNHLVEVRTFFGVDSKKGILTKALSGKENEAPLHSRQPILLHRIHSVVFRQASEHSIYEKSKRR